MWLMIYSIGVLKGFEPQISGLQCVRANHVAKWILAWPSKIESQYQIGHSSVFAPALYRSGFVN